MTECKNEQRDYYCKEYRIWWLAWVILRSYLSSWMSKTICVKGLEPSLTVSRWVSTSKTLDLPACLTGKSSWSDMVTCKRADTKFAWVWPCQSQPKNVYYYQTINVHISMLTKVTSTLFDQLKHSNTPPPLLCRTQAPCNPPPGTPPT